MKTLLWSIIAICLAAIAFALWRLAHREAARQRESEMRSAELVAEAIRAKARIPKPDGQD